MRKNKFHLLFLIFIPVLILVYLSCNLFSSSITNNANQTWATLKATDETLVELGDGSHTVEINPDTTLAVGETGSVFGLEVTLTNIGFISQVENADPNHPRENWFVDFLVKNTTSGILYGIHPVVNTQLQYIINGYYIWDMPEESQCSPEIRILASGFQPSTSFNCHFIYSVPSDERNLYWVYMRTDNVEDSSYEERYLVYQIR